MQMRRMIAWNNIKSIVHNYIMRYTVNMEIDWSRTYITIIIIIQRVPLPTISIFHINNNIRTHKLITIIDIQNRYERSTGMKTGKLRIDSRLYRLTDRPASTGKLAFGPRVHVRNSNFDDVEWKKIYSSTRYESRREIRDIAKHADRARVNSAHATDSCGSPKHEREQLTAERRTSCTRRVKKSTESYRWRIAAAHGKRNTRRTTRIAKKKKTFARRWTFFMLTLNVVFFFVCDCFGIRITSRRPKKPQTGRPAGYVVIIRYISRSASGLNSRTR